jgi:hypothetical protein
MFDDWARLCWIARPWQVFALESGAGEFKASESAGASNSMSEPVPVPRLRGGGARRCNGKLGLEGFVDPRKI